MTNDNHSEEYHKKGAGGKFGAKAGHNLLDLVKTSENDDAIIIIIPKNEALARSAPRVVTEGSNSGQCLKNISTERVLRLTLVSTGAKFLTECAEGESRIVFHQ